jgi:serine/threonine protein kinase
VLKTGSIGKKILASMKTPQPRANRIAPLVNIPTVARAAAVPMPNINAPQNYGRLSKPLSPNSYERYGPIIAAVDKKVKVDGTFYIAPNTERAALWNANIPSSVPSRARTPKKYMEHIFGPLEQFQRPQSGTYGAVYKVPVTDARVDVLSSLVQRLTSRVVHAMPQPGNVIAVKIGIPLVLNPDMEEFQELVQDGVHEARVHRAVVRGQWMGMTGASIVPPFYFSGYDPEYGVFIHITGFVTGQTLFHRLNQRSLSAQIAANVEAAILLFWCLGFVHADMHTGNIMVQDDGSVRLIDFGRTQPITSELTTRTRGVVLSALHGLRFGNAWPASTIMEAWRALSEFTNARANWNLWSPNGRALVAILRRATDDGASRNLPAARRLAWQQLGFTF